MEDTETKVTSDTIEKSILKEAMVALDQKELLKTAQLAKAQRTQKSQDSEVYSEEQVQNYVNHLTSLVPQWAEKGYTYIEYDCSSLPKMVTKQIGKMFKEQNPEIMVITDLGKQFVVCDWSGKNEC